MLQVGDIDLAQGVLNIRHSKGPSQHYVVLHDTMRDLLRRYHTAMQALHPKRQYFFPAPTGASLSNGWVVYNFRALWYRENTPRATAAGRRDLALIAALYGTAARIDEILSLTVGQLHLDARTPHVTILGKGHKMRTLYLLPKAVAHLKSHLKEFHGGIAAPDAYVFYSRNAGPHGKMSQMAASKRLKRHAQTARQSCVEVPLDFHAHQLRHAKASHWLEDGMNIVPISLLLGHEQLQTTMVYLDVTIEQKAKALATLEDENSRKVPKKSKTPKPLWQVSVA